jgi:hypothetical protein
MNLQIIEMDYACHPGGCFMYEVHEMGNVIDIPLFESEFLHEAIDFCYAAGVDFEVRTVAAWRLANE